jgi:hypothetical protein
VSARGPGGGDDLDGLLDELTPMRLRADHWDSVGAELASVDRSSPDAVERVSQVVFEARIQRRFQAGRAPSTLPPTKQTSALPWVGLVCGGLLLAVGGLLGGGPVLIGVALLGVFVFGVAMAGSRVAHARPRTAQMTSAEPPVPMPPPVADEVRRLHGR